LTVPNPGPSPPRVGKLYLRENIPRVFPTHVEEISGPKDLVRGIDPKGPM